MQYNCITSLLGTAVSSLALDAMTFGTETDEAGSHAQLARFLDADGNLVQTPPMCTAAAPARRSSATGLAGNAGNQTGSCWPARGVLHPRRTG